MWSGWCAWLWNGRSGWWFELWVSAVRLWLFLQCVCRRHRMQVSSSLHAVVAVVACNRRHCCHRAYRCHCMHMAAIAVIACIGMSCTLPRRHGVHACMQECTMSATTRHECSNAPLLQVCAMNAQREPGCMNNAWVHACAMLARTTIYEALIPCWHCMQSSWSSRALIVSRSSSSSCASASLSQSRSSSRVA